MYLKHITAVFCRVCVDGKIEVAKLQVSDEHAIIICHSKRVKTFRQAGWLTNLKDLAAMRFW